jgi:hypothetical protein
MDDRTDLLRRVVIMHNTMARDFEPTQHRDACLERLEDLFDCLIHKRIFVLQPKPREQEEA